MLHTGNSKIETTLYSIINSTTWKDCSITCINLNRHTFVFYLQTNAKTSILQVVFFSSRMYTASDNMATLKSYIAEIKLPWACTFGWLIEDHVAMLPVGLQQAISESSSETIHMKRSSTCWFIFMQNQTHFHVWCMKGFARGLVLKPKHRVTQKWPTTRSNLEGEVCK